MWWCCFDINQNFSPEKLESEIRKRLLTAELNQSVDCTILPSDRYKFLATDTREVAVIFVEAMIHLGLEGINTIPDL